MTRQGGDAEFQCFPGVKKTAGKILVVVIISFLLAVMTIFSGAGSTSLWNFRLPTDLETPTNSRLIVSIYKRSISSASDPQGENEDDRKNDITAIGKYSNMYLQNRHKPFSKRRVKKVLMANEYWKFHDDSVNRSRDTTSRRRKRSVSSNSAVRT